MVRSERRETSYSRNSLALLVAIVALGIAHLNFDPTCTGGEGGRKHHPRRAAILPHSVAPESGTILTSASAADETGSSGVTAALAGQEDPNRLSGVWAVKMAAALLQKGCDNFSRVPDYTANMFKQERIQGALSDGQNIDLKVRHEPFSIYMKWQSGDRGRQLIYVQGQNDGNMLVQPGGIKGRLTGLLSLEPTGSLALSESRYPIMKAGLLQLGFSILEYQKQDIARGTGFRCDLQDRQDFDGRACYLYHIEYESPEVNATYRKSLIFIDNELLMPICVKNFGWVKDANPQQLDEESLIEFYAYTDLRMSQELGAVDFDQHNREYKLRVR